MACMALATLSGCIESLIVDGPITISSPEPSGAITKVSLSEEQQACVRAGNAFAFNTLAQLYKEAPGSMVFSPLSLQYALAMTVNGASGQTAGEITKVLGYGEDLTALNEYCNILLRELPAVDPDVALKLTDALLVHKKYPLQKAFSKVMNDTYYAPVEYINPSSPKEIVDRINEWARQNTNGFIYPLLKQDDITPDFAAAIMNALYFKARWSGGDHNPMFREELTIKNQPFYLDGGGQTKVDMMPAARNFPYAKRDGYRVAAIPYSNGKYSMYILLPDESGKEGLSKLMNKLPGEKWEDITASLTKDTEVILRLPKFESESRFELPRTMKALGMRRAFDDKSAEFDLMFDVPEEQFYISNIIQKARINVAEWGTEAAAVTVVIIEKDGSAGPGQHEEVHFYADHPFVYVIAEQTSGAILFEGVFTGR